MTADDHIAAAAGFHAQLVELDVRRSALIEGRAQAIEQARLAGATQRQIGSALGLSHGRIGQMEKARRK